MKNKALKLCAITLAIYLVAGVLFYFAAGDSLFQTSETVYGISGSPVVELDEDTSIEQTFYCEQDSFDYMTLKTEKSTTVEATAEVILVEIFPESYKSDPTVEPLREMEIELDSISDHTSLTIDCDKPIDGAKGQTYVLKLSVPQGTSGMEFKYGDSVSTGRADVSVEISPEEAMTLNGKEFYTEDEEGNKTYYNLAMDVTGINYHFFGEYYWFFYAGVAVLLAAYLAFLYSRYRKGKKAPGLGVALSLNKYSFLIHQLVSRDFKTKYKRSILGMLWSFLNPLLTMSVQYVVFSYLFKSDINNFVVYLLTGIVCYNFFNEATNMCLMSIVGNATLISKVYVPKYIYPFSRSLSSCINLLLALIPLFICCIFTKAPLSMSLLIIPFVLIMLFLLSYGVGLILATLMVFFRDTQFLWGIMTMILMYLTPIFYPETIIPDRFMTIYKCNPLYHILRFMRSILIDGQSLEPKAYLICAALCIIPFIIGVLVFRKNEDKFVLNI